jgi:hypothetical protein
MAVTVWPEDIELQNEINCFVCDEPVNIGNAIIGPTGLKGEPLLTCRKHLTLSESSRFLRAYIDLSVMQRKIREKFE